MTGINSDDAALSWLPSTDDRGVVGYEVYRDGDVILAMDNQEIRDLKAFDAVAARAARSRGAVSVLVRRGEWVNYLVIRPNR